MLKALYINSIGGTALYDRADFSQQAVSLYFLRSRPTSCSQGKGEHVAGLSIIDALMFNELTAVRRMLAEMDLV